MRNSILCFSIISLLLIFLQLQHNLVACSLSPHLQKLALFHFNQTFTISSDPSSFICYYYSYDHVYEIPSRAKTKNWSMSSDHCTWEGVSCDDKTGDVIGLDLSCSQLQGAILPNSTLFQLSHLRFLNLSQNDFSHSNQFPQEFGFFAKGLTHLNLSYTFLSGRVPSGISHLYKLVSLDLSRNYEAWAKLEEEVFKSLLQNLTHLRVLNLNNINISSVLPVNISTSLRVLQLSYTHIHGVVPQEVFHLPNLEFLDLSLNNHLRATLPKVKWGSKVTLQHLHLIDINIDGGIPDSIGFLESLVSLYLSHCNLSGPIPKFIGQLVQLTHLGLSSNNLSGPILTFLTRLADLRYISLQYNNFTGPFPSFLAHSSKLVVLYLDSNSFTGSLPRSLFHLPSLESLDLANNAFTGPLHEFDSSFSRLRSFSCKNNSLYGYIPHSFSQLVNLTFLDFQSNNFSGVLDLEMFSGLKYLESLDLSYNSLSVTSTTMATLPPTLYYLGLSSCNMKEFPRFSTDANIFLYSIDLSNNKIEGEIPHWIGSLGMSYLNLSHNKLIGGLEQLPWGYITYLDLQDNKLDGSLPTLMCSSSYLKILNLSHNKLSGVLPICHTNLYWLSVLDLRRNNIQGNIPATLSNFRYLETINLNGNRLQGSIPSSFAEFDYLAVLDLGNNQINDTFPRCLEALPNLQVLVLKSNKFYGLINTSSQIVHPFPSLRIIDLSENEFSGPLPAKYFRNFKAMMNSDVSKIDRSYMNHSSSSSYYYYSNSTTLVIKGVDIELVKILTIFTTMDVSTNHFEGEIVESIGNLVSLRLLNLSHNHLRGRIPFMIGNLSMLESLDLSFNQLEGEIPQQLTSIYTLERLNLSCNQLSGHIPEGSQFNTFDADSYGGNFRLCGNPLSKKCEHDIVEQESDEDDDYFFSGFTWEAVVIGYGCGVVPAFITGYLMLLARKPKWFAGIIGRELGLKIRRMEIRMRY